MKYILTIIFILLIQITSNAQQPFSVSPVSAPVLPIPAPTQPAVITFDSYSNIFAEEEKESLQNLVAELKKDDYLLKYSTICIISYAGQRNYSGEALKKLNQIKSYLVKNEKIGADRIYTIDGGYQENWAVKLFIVPPGVPPGMPPGMALGTSLPVSSPTIDENDIKKRRVTKPPVKQRLSNAKKKRL